MFDGGVLDSADAGVTMQYSQKRIIADVLSTHANEHIKNDIQAMMRRKLDESLSSAICGTCTASDNEPKSLTFDDVREAMQTLRDEQHRLASDAINQAYGVDIPGDLALEYLKLYRDRYLVSPFTFTVSS